MKFPVVLAMVLAIHHLADALTFPKVKFGDHVMVDLNVDTLYRRTLLDYRYRDDQAFDSLKRSAYLAKGYVEDRQAGILRREMSTKQWFTMDSRNRLAVVWMHQVLRPDSTADLRIDMVYDEQDRLVQEIRIVAGPSGKIDTTFYTWTHAGCADSRKRTLDGFDERVTWKVDALGRCSEGTQETRYGTSEWYWNSLHHQTWGPFGPLQLAEVSGSDTLALRRISYNPRGIAIADSSWIRNGTGNLLLDEGCATFLEGDWFSKRVCESSRGFQDRTDVLSIAPSSLDVHKRKDRRGIRLEHQIRNGWVSLRNVGPQRVALQIRSVTGALQAVVDLEPGDVWSNPTSQRILLWKARSPGEVSTGKLTVLP